jgi:hypothetical protein
MKRKYRNAWTRAAILLGTIVGSCAPANAGSDHNTDTYAGDYTGGSLPAGTFVALQYLGYAHADAFIDPAGRNLPNSHANIFEEFTRCAYLGQLGGHPFVIDAELPFATLTDVNVPGTNNLVAGGLVDPVVDFTLFLTASRDAQRWLGLTNFFYLPFGRRFDNQKAINVSTARQFTDVLQLGYTEGLAKFSQALNGVFFDLIANVSLPGDGTSPLLIANPASSPVPGVLSYSGLVQSPSYDVKAFLRYEPSTFLFAAIGIEKSWGGEQVAAVGKFAVTGAPIVIPQPNLSLSKDDYLRGHFQFQVPLARDFAIGGDVFHDFETVGGFRNDFGIEVRLSKFFFPAPSKISSLIGAPKS